MPYAKDINSSIFYLTINNNLLATVISLSKNLNNGSLIESFVLSNDYIFVGNIFLYFSTTSNKSYNHYT